MTEHRLDDDARKLLGTLLDSFEELELVRVLRASRTAMSEDDLGRECRFAPDTAHEAVANLVRLGVLKTGDTGIVRLGTAARASAFEALMAIYEADPLLVLSALSAIAMERIRNMTARAFADAFVFRRKRGDSDG